MRFDLASGGLSIALLRFLSRSLVFALPLGARVYPQDPVEFARTEIAQAAAHTGRAAPHVEFSVDAGLPDQGYKITESSGDRYIVSGHDAVAEMYGGLDLADDLRIGASLKYKGAVQVPYLAQRGIKFNIPLDLRTPSYSDNGDSFQANIPDMWSMQFWHTYLDELARDRYNVLSLWSLHPFPSLVKVPEFPDVALNDVWRTTARLDDTFSTNGYDMVRPYMLEQHEVVKRITIEQKIQFWREVMQYAYDRGISIYIFTWNIFTWGAEGKYGITSAQDNPATINYFRASVRELVTTYPLLAGIGITAGEHMNPKLSGDLATENWLWRTYGEGITEGLREQPGRPFRFIHRLHQTSPESLRKAFQGYTGAFDVEFKYSVAHMYSLAKPPFIEDLLPTLTNGLRTWVTLRNDDIYTFRWGDPDYARDYIRAIPPADKVAGYLMGCDGYCWGREAIAREPTTPRQLVMQKQWYSFMLWGRLSFNPTISDDYFQRVLADHFPEVSGADLYQASVTSSKIIPQITRFFWGDIDIRWFPELCTQYPTPRGFYTVADFMRGQCMPGSGIINIREWRLADVGGVEVGKMTPLEVAAALQGWSTTTLASVEKLRAQPAGDSELRLTLGDYEGFARLGAYYAEKIAGACDLAKFDLNGEVPLQKSAVIHLAHAAEHWRAYAAAVGKQYIPQLLNRIGNSDPSGLTTRVDEDLSIARAWLPHTLNRPPP